MDKAIYNVTISVLTRENLKKANLMEKAPFQLKVVLINFLDSLLRVFLNIKQVNIYLKSLVPKKKKTIQKLKVEKMLKRVLHQLTKEKVPATLSK